MTHIVICQTFNDWSNKFKEGIVTGTVSDNELTKDIKYHCESLDFIKGHWEPWEALRTEHPG